MKARAYESTHTALSQPTQHAATSGDGHTTTRTVLGALDPMPTARERSIDFPGTVDPMDNGIASPLGLALLLVVHLLPLPPPQDAVPAGNLGVATKACIYYMQAGGAGERERG